MTRSGPQSICGMDVAYNSTKAGEVQRKPRVIDLYEQDPYERGLHHGEELREEISAIFKAWKRHLRQRLGLTRGFMRGVAAKMAYFLAFFRHTPRDFKAEMKGIADGSGQSYKNIAFMNCFDDGMRVFLQRGNPTFCSAFASHTDSGNIIAGFNLDEGIIQEEFIKFTTVFRYRSAITGVRLMSIMLPGYIGVTRGINDRGVFLGHNTTHVKDARRPGLPHPLLLRKALEQPTVAGVCGTIIGTRRTIGSTILAGNSQDALVLELATNAYAIRNLQSTFIACTNHFLTQHMQPYYKPEYIIPGMGFSDFLLNPKYSKYRLDRLNELLQTSTPQTPKDGCKILEQVANDMTVQTVIFNPSEPALYVTIPRSGFPPACRDCDLVRFTFEGGAQ